MKKRLLSLFLTLVMVLGLIPAMTLPVFADTASGNSRAGGGTAAFGLPLEEYPQQGSTEYWNLMASAPFGALTSDNVDRPITINAKNELFLSYGWDANKKDGANWMRTYDASVDSGTPGDLGQFNNKTDPSFTTSMANKSGWKAYFADSAGFNPGTGKDQYIAYLYFDNGGKLRLRVLDRGLNEKANVQVDGDNFAPSKLDCYAGGGMLCVVCGDFDADGTDSIIVNSPRVGIKEYTWVSNSIQGGAEITGSLSELHDFLTGSNRNNVQMVADDIDRDGFDELVVTTSRGNSNGNSKLYILEKVGDSWQITYQVNIQANSPATAVGNVIASQMADMPELVTAGFTDNTDDTFYWRVTKFNGWKGSNSDGKNWIANYTLEAEGTHANNGWQNTSNAGHYSDDSEIHPMGVACVNYKGGANAEGIFIQGEVFDYRSAEGESGSATLERAFIDDYYTSSDKGSGAWVLTNSQVEDIAVGNFDGNDEGREQVIFTTILKQSLGYNNAFSFLNVYEYDGSSWSSTMTNWFIDHKGKGFVTLTAFDDDSDSVVAKFQSMEKKYSQPDVLAVLESFPYYEELGEDAWGESNTTFSTEKGSGSAHENSHSLNTNVVLGFEVSTPVPPITGGYELNINNNFTWSSATSTEKQFTLDFANNSGDHAVVVYQAPILNYTYVDINHGNQPIHIEKMLDANYAMISLDSYNEQAAQFSGMTIIDESYLPTPGDPWSYPSSVTGATNANKELEGSDVEAATQWVSYGNTSGNIVQEFECVDTVEDTFTYDFSVDFTAYMSVFGLKAGGGAGYGYSVSNTTMNTSGVTRSGTVQGIGGTEWDDRYDFQWRFAHWMLNINGKKVPVLGYLVQNQLSPPSPPENVDGTDITSTSFTLTWEQGGRPADEYRVYIQYDDGDYGLLGIVDRPLDDDGSGDFGFDIGDLSPGETYTFVVRGFGDGVESVDSESYVLTTNPDSEQRVVINPVKDVTVAEGEDAVFSTVVDLADAGNASYQWQYRSPSSNVWQDAENGKSMSLTLQSVTRDMDGYQYRLKVSANKGVNRYTYYSNTATLKIGTNPAIANVSMRDYTGGAGSKADPYIGSGTYTEQITSISSEEQTFNGEFDHGDHSDPVYKVGGSYVAVCTTGSVTYTQVTLDEASHSFTAVEAGTLTPTLQWVGDSNAPLTPEQVPAGFDGSTGVTKKIGSETYYEMVEWIEENGVLRPDSVKTYWLKEGDTEVKYYETENGESFTEKEGFKPSSDENAFTSPAYFHDEATGLETDTKLVLEGDGGFFALNNTEAWAVDTDFKNVTSRNVITVDDTQVDVDTGLIERYTYTKMVEVETTQAEVNNGTSVTLQANLTYARGGNLPDGTRASFVITNLDTGAVTTISATVENGAISSSWTAPSPGLYAIRATTVSTATISAASSQNTIYYRAAGDPEAQEYRITQSGQNVPPESVVYGNNAVLALSTREGSGGVWSPVSDLSGMYIELVKPDGTSEKLEQLTLATRGRAAGSYTIRVWESEEAYEANHINSPAKALTSTTIQVDYAKVTISPKIGSSTPTNISQIELEYSLVGGLRDDFSDIADYIEAVCTLYKEDGGIDESSYGRFPVSLRWKTDPDGVTTVAERREKIEASYRVTMETGMIEHLAEVAPVNFNCGEGGTISGAVTNVSSTLSIETGTNQRYGSTLQFTARPSTNHYVSEWKINGEVVNRDRLPAGVTITEMAGSTGNEMLKITDFGEAFLAKAGASTPVGQLTVEANFSNQRATVNFSKADGDGELTAALQSGTPLNNGSNINYGATVVFTATPAPGYMVKEWNVNGEIYKHQESGGIYRENTLTLTDIQLEDVKEGTLTVTVTFETEKFTKVSFSMVTRKDDEGDVWQTFAAGKITVTTSDGEPVTGVDPGASGTFSITQGTAFTFTAAIDEPDMNAVQQWQYRTSEDGDWITVPESNGKTQYTYENPDSDVLEVRVCIDRAQTYTLTWEVKGQDGGAAPGAANATLTATSNGEPIEAGDHTAYISVDFTLELSDDYYVVEWSSNVVQDESDPKKARLESLTAENTTVTVTVAEKPTLELPEIENASLITVKGTYAGGSTIWTYPGENDNLHYDPGTDLEITVTPSDNYYVSQLQGQTCTAAHGAQTHTLTAQNEDVTVSATLTEKPTITLPEEFENGTITVSGTYAGGSVQWKFPENTNENYHYDPNTDLTITVTPDADYYVETIQERAFGASHGAKNTTLTSWNENVTVSATLLEKPQITWEEEYTGGTVTVTGMYNGAQKTWTLPGEAIIHYDPDTALTITATPGDDYYVGTINGETFDSTNGAKSKTLSNQTSNVHVTVAFEEKPQLTLPEEFANGTLTVTGTYNGAQKTWTLPGDNVNLHYDPNTGITVKVEPSMGYVLNNTTGWTIPANSDDATREYTANDVRNGLDISDDLVALRQLGKITVHFFVISEGGWQGPDNGGVAHGTLNATVSRKEMPSYSNSGAADDEKTDNVDDHTLNVYEGGSVTLNAAGITGAEDSQTQPHTVDYWSTDKNGNFTLPLQSGGEDVIRRDLTITYAQLEELARSSGTEAEGALYIGVRFTTKGARVHFSMIDGQEDLGDVTAELTSSRTPLNDYDYIGIDTSVTFAAVIRDPDHYEVKNWILGEQPQVGETSDTFTYISTGTNLVVKLELQGRILESFTVVSGGHGQVTQSSDSVRYGESVTLTAVADPGYEFEGWYRDGALIEGADAEYTPETVENTTYTAHFKPVQGLSLSFAVSDEEGGAITAAADGETYTSGESTLQGGQVVVLTLNLEDGWRLVRDGQQWANLPEGAQVSADGLTVTLPALTGSLSDTITANVEQIPVYTVTVQQPVAAWKIIAYVDGVQQETDQFDVLEGTTVTFDCTFVGGPSYEFKGWLVDGESSGNGTDPLTLTVTAPVTVSANTTIGVMRSLMIEVEDQGEVDVPVSAMVEGLSTSYGVGTHEIPKDSVITVTATPGENRMIKSWSVNGVVQNTADGRPILELKLPTFTLDEDTTILIVFTEKKVHAYPESEEGYYTVSDVTSYPSGENSGVEGGKYREGGDLKFTITPVEGADGEILVPYLEGLMEMGDEVTVTENEDGGWDVDIHGVKNEVKLPSFRVKLNTGIPDDKLGGLKSDESVLDTLEKYLPEGVTQVSDITGEIIEDVMTKVAAEAVPSAPDDNVEVYDVELQRYDETESEWKSITDADEFPDGGLTVILPYPEGTDSRDTFTVIHMFTVANGDKMPGQREVFKKNNGLENTSAGLRFTVNSLSPIAVVWEKYKAPTGGGGGGGGGVPGSPVIVPEKVPGGKIGADREEAAQNELVTLTVTPNSGFTVGTLTVTDANGDPVEILDNGDGIYTFLMAETGVRVEVTFVLDCERDETCPMLPFKDTSPQAWYHDGIHYCVEHNLMDGLSSTVFGPGDATKRDMIVTILYRLENEPEVGNSAFKDVPAGAWYAKAVAWAAANEIVDGYSDTVFGPEDPVTREQLSAILYRYAKYKGYDVTRQAELSGYTDAGRVTGYAVDAVRWAVAEGLIAGVTETTLVPNGNSTRAQTATILMRFCESVEEK